MKALKLSNVLDALIKDTEGYEKISFADVVHALNHRGFGPLLLIPSLIVILPTGAIPGVPALAGAFIVLIAVQIILGRKNPWLPGKIKKFNLKRTRFLTVLNKSRPFMQFIDRYIEPRFEFFTNEIAQRLIAGLCIVLAVIMIVVGFIPYLPALFSLPIFFFALGFTAHDSLMTILGLIFSLAAFLMLGYLFGVFGGEQTFQIEYPYIGYIRIKS